jgi:hypothetical protein
MGKSHQANRHSFQRIPSPLKRLTALLETRRPLYAAKSQEFGRPLGGPAPPQPFPESLVDKGVAGPAALYGDRLNWSRRSPSMKIRVITLYPATENRSAPQNRAAIGNDRQHAGQGGATRRIKNRHASNTEVGAENYSAVKMSAGSSRPFKSPSTTSAIRLRSKYVAANSTTWSLVTASMSLASSSTGISRRK